MKHREIIADNLSQAGWAWGWGWAVDSQGRTIWIADAYRGDRKRFVVRAEERLTAFMEREKAIRSIKSKRINSAVKFETDPSRASNQSNA
jgi:hypothetical protein